MALEDLGDGRTKLVSVSLFLTTEERDAMLRSGMADGANQSYAALDRLLSSPELLRESPEPARRAVAKVAFTMYPVTDVARARRFYEQLLGLAVGMAGNDGDKHWVEYDLPGGGCLALTNTTGAAPSADAGGTVALEVSDLVSLMEQLKQAGVTFKSGVIRGPHCRMAMCLDSEGNQLDGAGPA